MSHEDLTQFVYNLKSKFENLGKYLTGVHESVDAHATSLEQLWRGCHGQTANFNTLQREVETQVRDVKHSVEQLTLQVVQSDADIDVLKVAIQLNDAQVKEALHNNDNSLRAHIDGMEAQLRRDFGSSVAGPTAGPCSCRREFASTATA